MSTSSTTTMASLATKICNQIATIFTKATETEEYPAVLDVLVSEVAETGANKGSKVFLYGVGREGLMLRATCMRLTHLGLNAHFVLDQTTPPALPGDLLIASAGPGSFPTVDAVCASARAAAARVLVLTAHPDAACAARYATAVGYLPAQTMADHDSEEGERPLMLMGSAYEGALFVLCEMLVFKLGELLGQTVPHIRSRHANLE